MVVTNSLLTQDHMRYRMQIAHTNCPRLQHISEPILTATPVRAACTSPLAIRLGGWGMRCALSMQPRLFTPSDFKDCITGTPFGGAQGRTLIMIRTVIGW